jgi:hypothetical protein
MALFSNMKDIAKADQPPARVMVASGRSTDRLDIFHCLPTGILKQSLEEIRFESDHPLPLGSTVDIKMARESPDRKKRNAVYSVIRGRIRECNPVEGSHGKRYAVTVEIFETVVQTEVSTSRLGLIGSESL